MQAIVGLVGAFIGGFLVLIGDAVRRRVEWRREGQQRLIDACAAFAIQVNALVGDLADERRRGTAQHDALLIRPERYEATTRFFMASGSEPLQPAARAMIRSCRAMLHNWDDDADWRHAYDEYYAAVRSFEGGVRALRA